MNDTLIEKKHRESFGNAYGGSRTITKKRQFYYDKPREYRLTVIEAYHRCGDQYYTWLRGSDECLYMISSGNNNLFRATVGDVICVIAKRKRKGSLGGLRYTQLWYAKQKETTEAV